MEFISSLQKLVNQTNVMLIEIELEGGIINQSWHEYDQCYVQDWDNGKIGFVFYLQGEKAGAYATDANLINKYMVYNESETPVKEKHVYLFVKGIPLKPLLTDKMFQLFHYEVPLSDNFGIHHLYNSSRDKSRLSEKQFLQECYEHDMFSIKKYHLSPVSHTYSTKMEEMLDLSQLKEYHQENESTIHALLQVINTMKSYHYEVRLHEKMEINQENQLSFHTKARAYIPEWDLILSPSTQDITSILTSFAQKEKRVGVVTTEFNSMGDIVVAYLIERKNQFFELYKVYLENKFKQEWQAQNQLWERIDSLSQKQRT